jgi:hypothetical protein
MTTSAKIKAGAAALAVVLAVPGAAHAQISTMQMMEWCKPVLVAKPMESYQTGEGGLCLGAFIALHALSYDHLYGHNESMLGVCPPSSVEPIQMVRIFDAYARQHPEIQHQSFEGTALAAFKPVFPCK